MARIGRRHRAQEQTWVVSQTTSPGFYPSSTTYPSSSLYPGGLYGSFQGMLAQRAFGPLPPLIVNGPIPSLQQQQDAFFFRIPVQGRRALTRRYPLPGWRGRPVRQTGLGTTWIQAATDRFLGPRNPQILTPAVNVRTRVWLVAVHDRRKMTRRFPLQGWDSGPVRETGQPATWNLQLTGRRLGPQPPQIIGPGAWLKGQLNITVLLQAIRQRDRMRNRARPDNQFTSMVGGARGPPSVVWPPTVITTPPAALAPVKVTLAASPRRARRTHWHLPLVIVASAPAPAIVTSSEAVWTRLRRARVAKSKLSPPAVITPLPPLRPIRVWLAVEQRVQRIRRTRSNLSPPAVVTPLPLSRPIQVWTVFKSRLERVRRAPNSVFAVVLGATGPVNVTPPVASGTTAVGDTVSTTDGTWSGTAPFAYTYQWQSSPDGVFWTDIVGATSNTYVLTISELNDFVRAVVTASNIVGATAAASNQLGPVTLPAVAIVCDVLTGTPVVCGPLTATQAADGLLTLTPVAAYAGFYPSSGTYPSSTLYPGAGSGSVAATPLSDSSLTLGVL